jgi:hypothetical protein
MIDAGLEKLSRKTYYALIYPEHNCFAALDRDSGNHYRVDDITLAWLRRDIQEFNDYVKMFPELAIIKVSFALEMIKDEE